MKNNVFSEMNILTKMMCVFYFLPFLVHVYNVRLIKKCKIGFPWQKIVSYRLASVSVTV